MSQYLVDGFGQANQSVAQAFSGGEVPPDLRGLVTHIQDVVNVEW
jgi:hypothetical protein